MNMDFEEKYRGWSTCEPVKLFEADIVRFVPEDYIGIEKNLQNESKYCDQLILWLDCDREGENIAFEVMECCLHTNRHLKISRARFSDMTNRSVFNAINNLSKPNEKDNMAVEARREIDLRIGSIFTRFQTMRIKRKFQGFNDITSISYGPCQFPTLGFIVDRYNKRETFVKEKCWKITCSKKVDESEAHFLWKRGRLFDKLCCVSLYEMCIEYQTAKVTKVIKREKRKWRPLPLNTIELQKLGASKLKLSSHQTMTIAENLYTKGIISYPRTETDIYNCSNEEIINIIQEQVSNSDWGLYAQNLMDGKYVPPKKGKNDDKAHPPIHPVKNVNDLNGDEKALYQLITRHFLACCSEDAIGHETVVTIEIGYEIFTCSGSTLTEKNYLDIYTYDKWYSKTIPIFKENETFIPDSLLIVEEETQAPPLLSEESLIGLMDKNGIGTDATIAQHIKTITDRGYTYKKDGVYVPTELGLALIEAYNSIGFQLSKPNLRAKMENEMKDISLGKTSKDLVLMENIQMYKSIYKEVIKNVDKLDQVLKKYFKEIGESETLTILNKSFSQCKCKSMMILKKTNDDNRILQCNTCKNTLILPPKLEFVPVNQICPLCNYQALQGSLNNTSYHICPYCYSNPPDIENLTNGFRCYNCGEKKCPLSSKSEIFGKCPECKNDLQLKKTKEKYFIGCKGYPKCSKSIWLPSAEEISVTDENCEECNYKLLRFLFKDGQLPPTIPIDIISCVFCESELSPFIQHSKSIPKKRKNESVDPKQTKLDIYKKKKEIPKCEHQLECIELRCNQGKNQGKFFYKCPKQKKEDQCQFFEWKE